MQLLNSLRILFIGFLMGTADLIPGVSGGTIAFICGIYERLLNGIKAFDFEAIRLALRFDWAGLNRKLPIAFFLLLGTGLLAAVFSLSALLSRLFLSHPVELWSFFFGLILGSIALLVIETWRWRPIDWIAFVLFTAGTYWLVGLPVMQTPPTLPFIFLSGAIAICAMILPGISGSYLLVIMGKYHQILEAVSHRDYVTIAVFVAGIAVGILSFVRIVSWTLRTFQQVTMVALTGVMAGALRTVWPWKETVSTRLDSKGVEVPLMQVNVLPPENASLTIPLLLLLAGAAAVILISHIAQPAEEKHGVRP